MKPINIQGYEHYLVDESGVIYSSLSKIGTPLKEPKVLKQWPNKNVGYMQVVLRNKKLGLKPKCFYVHRLVGLTYIPNPDNKPEINHIIPDKTMNSVWNLEWVTGSENQKHIHKSGYVAYSQYKKLNKNPKLIQEGLLHFEKHSNISELKKIWNCSNTTIDKIFVDNGLPKIKDRVYRKLTPDMITTLKNEIKEFIKTKGHSDKDKINEFRLYVNQKHNIRIGFGLYHKLKSEVKKDK